MRSTGPPATTPSPKGLRAGLAAVALAALLAVAWFATRGDDAVADGGGVSTPAAGPAPATLADDAATAPVAPTPAAGERAVAGAAAGAAPELEAAGAPPPDDRLTGVVVDGYGQPVVGARVVLDARSLEEFTVLDVAENRRFDVLGEALTDAAGEFAFDARPGRPLRLTAGAPGYAAVREAPAFGGNQYRLELGAQAVLEGRFTRAQDGAPAADVRLRGWLAGGVELFRGASDSDGRFRFAGLQPGTVTIDVEPPVLASPAWVRVDLVAGGTARLELALEEGFTVHGTVADARTGLSIPGAEVGAGWTYDRAVRADAEGRYALRGFGGPGVYEVFARAPGFGEARHAFDPGALPTEDVEVDFALPPARGASGRVVDTAGEPLAGVVAAAVASAWIDGGQATDWETVRTGADGRFAFASLDPRLAHQVVLRKPGYGTRVVDFPADERQRDHVGLGDLVLGPAARLLGRVVDEAGAPLPGLRVELEGHDDGRGALRDDGGEVAAMHYTSERETESDSRGRFHFADLAPGDYMLSARLPGTQSGTSRAVRVPAGVLVDDIELVLAVGGRVAGVALAPDGRPVSGVRVAAHEPGTANFFMPLAVVTTDAEGRFELVGLPGDEVLLHADTSTLRWFETLGPEPASPPVETVPVGATDLEVRLLDWATLEGVVVERDGAPVAGAALTARYDERTLIPLGSATTDADGAFAFEVPAGVEFELRVEVGEGDAARTERRTARAGGAPVEVRLP